MSWSPSLAQHVERIAVFGDEQWLFPGAPPTPASLRYWFSRAASANGVDELTPHDLRHFLASGLIASGCGVVTVQRALGHAQGTVTLNTYSHLWPTAEDKTRTAAAGLMRVALEPRADSSRTGEPAAAADISS
jgi:integrase